MLVQQIVSGLSMGSIYALVALGMVLIYKATDVMNFAQGELMMVSAFLAYQLVQYQFPPYLVFLLTFFGSAVIGVVLERLVIRPIMGAPHFSIVIATIGVSICLRSLVGILLGHDTFHIESFFSNEPVQLGGVAITPLNIWIIMISCGLMLILYLFFKLTIIGIAMRATAQSQTNAMLMGISVKNVFSLTWAISSGTGAVAGILVAPILYIDANMGLIAITAFAGAILGGFGSIPGAIVGSMLLGIMENLSGAYLPTGVKNFSAFVILIGVLIVKPTGIFGSQMHKRV